MQSAVGAKKERWGRNEGEKKNICNPFARVLAAHGRGSSRAVERARVVFMQLPDCASPCSMQGWDNSKLRPSYCVSVIAMKSSALVSA